VALLSSPIGVLTIVPSTGRLLGFTGVWNRPPATAQIAISHVLLPGVVAPATVKCRELDSFRNINGEGGTNGSSAFGGSNRAFEVLEPLAGVACTIAGEVPERASRKPFLGAVEGTINALEVAM
jgi:hypothetical protein